MFQTMTEIVAKLMSTVELADHLADLAILRDETEAIAAQWSARDAEIATLQEQHAATMEQMRAEAVAREQDFETRLDAHLATEAALQEQIASAVAAYKKAALAANPEIPPAMVDELGAAGSVDAIDAAIARARSFADQIKAHLSVPAGSPARGRIDMESMSSMEKIRHAITQ